MFSVQRPQTYRCSPSCELQSVCMSAPFFVVCMLSLPRRHPCCVLQDGYPLETVEAAHKSSLGATYTCLKLSVCGAIFVAAPRPSCRWTTGGFLSHSGGSLGDPSQPVAGLAASWCRCVRECKVQVCGTTTLGLYRRAAAVVGGSAVCCSFCASSSNAPTAGYPTHTTPAPSSATCLPCCPPRSSGQRPATMWTELWTSS